MAAEADRTALKGLEKRLFKLHAVAGGDKDLALTLLKAGANGGSGWEGCSDRNLPQAAAEGGDEEVVTALHRALIWGHTGAARALMVAGADTSLLDAEKRSALHYAIRGGHLQLAGDAIIGATNLQAKDVNGDNPLHFAAAHDDKFVSTILRRGARVDRPNREGKYPLHVEVEYNRLTVAEALLTVGANLNVRFGISKRYSPLYFALRRSPAMTRALLQHGAASFEPYHGVCGKHSSVGLTPLHVAAYYHRSLSMAALLRSGANVDAEADNGLTPLHMVCKTSLAPGSVKANDLLLSWDADETTTDHDGRTPKALVSGRSSLRWRVRQKLANAPADRLWRSRGMLVMCRASPQKVTGTGRGGRGGRARARIGSGRGRGGRSASRGRRNGNLLARVVGQKDDELFRAIATFL
ncbi:unnamed protein product [Ectocarpus sp. CCAP 1310/34]|nr:unnamed protein product [Ectocarpus sp. CCAP 1310/34]